MTTPVIHSGQSNTWAPAAAENINNTIYFTGLRGNALYQAQTQEGDITDISKHLTNYGRLREVEKRNGNLYISTSNTDGRGNANQNDDKIIKVNPDNLN